MANEKHPILTRPLPDILDEQTDTLAALRETARFANEQLSRLRNAVTDFEQVKQTAIEAWNMAHAAKGTADEALARANIVGRTSLESADYKRTRLIDSGKWTLKGE